MKIITKVKPPSGDFLDLSNDKVYETYDQEGANGDVYCRAFWIKDDDGYALYCLEKKCGHLHFGDWIIVEEKEI